MVDRPRMCGHRTRGGYGRTPGDSCFEYLGLSRNYLGATMLHVEPFFPPFSLVQNRTGYFSASFSPLRCSALQPSPQCTATAPAVHCIRPRSALHPSLQVRASVLARTCFSTELVLLLSHIWAVYGRFGMFPASLKYMRSPSQWVLNDSESTFEIQMVSYFFESEVKCQNPKRGKTSEDLFDLIQ